VVENLEKGSAETEAVEERPESESCLSPIVRVSCVEPQEDRSTSGEGVDQAQQETNSAEDEHCEIGREVGSGGVANTTESLEGGWDSLFVVSTV